MSRAERRTARGRGLESGAAKCGGRQKFLFRNAERNVLSRANNAPSPPHPANKGRAHRAGAHLALHVELQLTQVAKLEPVLRACPRVALRSRLAAHRAPLHRHVAPPQTYGVQHVRVAHALKPVSTRRPVVSNARPHPSTHESPLRRSLKENDTPAFHHSATATCTRRTLDAPSIRCIANYLNDSWLSTTFPSPSTLPRRRGKGCTHGEVS